MKADIRSLFAAACITVVMLQPALASAGEPPLAAGTVQVAAFLSSQRFDGTVEAVRQTALAAQVPGAIAELNVKAGDAVKQGQVLLRIDARAAQQNSAASEAQVLAARAALDVAVRDYERQKQLQEKGFISLAALERAESQFKATSAQLKAQIAQASAAGIESRFYIVRAPYAGVVSEVPVMLGDMAMPGKPLLTIYDPSALRVTASVPQTALSRVAAGRPVRVELSGLPTDRANLVRPAMQVLPAVDPGTHSAQVRIDLPAGMQSVSPGTYARVWLQTQDEAGQRLYVPASAILRRADMTALYVLDGGGRPILRQVRTGPQQNGMVEVLAGVMAGERVALDPQAAAKGAR